MYNLRKTKSRDASMRSRSKSNSSINVDNQNTKNYRKNAKEDQISGHESEYQYSQSSLKKDIKEEKKLQLFDESSSESVSSNSDIHGEGDESNSDVNSDQDSNRIHEVRYASNLNEKETRSLIKSFYEANLSEVEVLKKNIKGLSKATVYRIFKKIRESGTIDRRPGSGRKK